MSNNALPHLRFLSNLSAKMLQGAHMRLERLHSRMCLARHCKTRRGHDSELLRPFRQGTARLLEDVDPLVQLVMRTRSRRLRI